jgi:hypothetical protein
VPYVAVWLLMRLPGFIADGCDAMDDGVFPLSGTILYGRYPVNDCSAMALQCVRLRLSKACAGIVIAIIL